MHLDELYETRRNPDYNVEGRRRNGINELLLNWTKKNCFATFTALPKVGMNPRSKYNTPLGVYCYPLWDSNIIADIERDQLPFAGNSPYISVIRASGNLVNLSSGSDFKDLNKQVAEWLANKLSDLMFEGLPASHEQIIEAIWAQVYMRAGREALLRIPAGIWWGFMRLSAALACEYRDTDERGRTVEGLGHVVDYALERFKSIRGVPAMWTRLMLDLGIDGVIDLGEGIIHENEPSQAVLLNPRDIKVVDRFQNPRAPQSYEVKSRGGFIHFLKKAKPDMSLLVSCIINGERKIVNKTERYVITVPEDPREFLKICAVYCRDTKNIGIISILRSAIENYKAGKYSPHYRPKVKMTLSLALMFARIVTTENEVANLVTQDCKSLYMDQQEIDEILTL